MKARFLSAIVALLLVVNSFGLASVKASDQIATSDFALGSFSKNIDLLDYARQHANAAGGIPPPSNWKSNLVVNYINQTGVQLLYMGYAGLDTGNASFQIPLQSIVERFNTTKGDLAMTTSSFLMMMAFNDTKTSLYQGSPDKDDNLWASFSIGTDYSAIFPAGKTPMPKTSVEVTPMTSNTDKSEWDWGMTYKDLAAVWWNISNSKMTLLPAALCRYNELSFNYKLVFNKADGTAKLYVSHTIGEMSDIWTFKRATLLPVIVHYNSTGCYNQRQQKLSSETLHDFLNSAHISMSIVMAQRTWVADKEVSNSINGANAGSDGVDVSKGAIQSTTTDGQKIFDISFGDKPTYKLETATGEKTYDAVTRTADVNFYARNPILRVQNSLLYFSNALAVRMFPAKYAETAKVWMNATKSSYLYVTSYPTYSGYEVIHDPVFTAYIPPVKTTTSGGVPIPNVAIILGLGVVVLFLMKRRQ